MGYIETNAHFIFKNQLVCLITIWDILKRPCRIKEVDWDYGLITIWDILKQEIQQYREIGTVGLITIWDILKP